MFENAYRSSPLSGQLTRIFVSPKRANGLFMAPFIDTLMLTTEASCILSAKRLRICVPLGPPAATCVRCPTAGLAATRNEVVSWITLLRPRSRHLQTDPPTPPTCVLPQLQARKVLILQNDCCLERSQGSGSDPRIHNCSTR